MRSFSVVSFPRKRESRAPARARAVRSDLAAQQQKAVEVATETYARDKASRVG